MLENYRLAIDALKEEIERKDQEADEQLEAIRELEYHLNQIEQRQREQERIEQ